MEEIQGHKTGVMPADLLKSYRERLERSLGFVSRSRELRQIVAALPDYAGDKKPITIVGPLGTGRRTVAKAIHLSSPDWWRPFVEVDLTGRADEEALKYLYGYKEGHIFAPSEIKPGIISKASQSTLCLKNFDRYSKAVQTELHNLYVKHEYQPVSSQQTEALGCRFIFTVQNEPKELSKVGYVGEEMCKVLSERMITLPPLSKRRDDIAPLAEKFIRECCNELCIPLKTLSKEAEKWLKKAPWNKNAGQLKKSIYFACLNTEDAVLCPNHFALAHDGNIGDYQQKQLDELSIQSLVEAKLRSFLGRLGKFEATDIHEAIMSRVEEPLLRLVLDKVRGNQIKASRILGINRNTLRTKLTTYNIKIAKDGRIR